MKYIIVDQNIHYYIIYYITILILVYSVNTFNDFHIYNNLQLNNSVEFVMFSVNVVVRQTCKNVTGVFSDSKLKRKMSSVQWFLIISKNDSDVSLWDRQYACSPV